MAKVITTELQHSGASAANITLDSSKNVTCENNLQVDGNVTVTGTLPADKLTGALPAISGANLTGVTDTKPFRNLVINGAMQVAQRGTSSTASGYGTVDRFTTSYSGHDEAITQAQESLTSSDTGPWALGFRKALKLTNGNQTSGAGATDSSQTLYKIEGQDINHSGWNYTDPNSKITLSFWVKSSVAQTFYIRLRAYATAAQKQYISSFALSANTWTKVTKTIPGHADLAGIASDNGNQFFIVWQHFYGTDYTGTQTENAWHTKDSSNNYPDMTTTWWTTNDATFHLTGVQLEAGDTATDFEHRSFGDELARCQRYYFMESGNDGDWMCTSMTQDSSDMYFFVNFPIPMRTLPSYTAEDKNVRHYGANPSDAFGAHGLAVSNQNTTSASGGGCTNTVLYKSGASITAGQAGVMQCQADGVKLQFSAEL